MTLPQSVLRILPQELLQLMSSVRPSELDRVEEIRLGAKRPVALSIDGGLTWLSSKGTPTQQLSAAYILPAAILHKTIEMVAESSLYALEEELRQGYITVEGGHRVGIAGRAVLALGRVKTQKEIAALNIRVARERHGVATKLLPQLLGEDKRVASTLIISPPQCGKTTLLRDLVRQISYGLPPLSHPRKVGIVDERSEIAATFDGVPQLDVGPNTDVLDACPKAEGMMMLIRSMSPDVLVTDEIGRPEDAIAIEEALHAGVTVLATAHGANLDDLKKRPVMKEILQKSYFQRLVVLSRRQAPGTIEDVIKSN